MQNANENNPMRFSANPMFVSEIDEWDSSKRENGRIFILGTTGDVIQGLGAIEQDIYIKSDKINKIFEDHPGMSIDSIKRIPEVLENPLLIMKSSNTVKSNTRLTIFGNEYVNEHINEDVNKSPMLVVLDLMPHEQGVFIDNMQKVVSSYGKDNDKSGKSAKEFVEESEVLYIKNDKKRITLLLQSVGFTRPKEWLLSDYIGSITYGNQNVNLKGEEFNNVVRFSLSGEVDNTGNELSIGQAEYFADSKVRDNEGRLMKMYHGTQNEFNVFSTVNGEKNGRAEGFGYYFTNMYSMANSYGDRVYETNDGETDIKDTWVSNYVYTYDGKPFTEYCREVAFRILTNPTNESDVDILGELINANGIYSYDAAMPFYEILTDETGIDGMIVGDAKTGGVTLAFYPEQIKSTDNLAPTENPDIRYSAYKKEEYNRYGWAADNMLLTKKEFALFFKSVGALNLGDYITKLRLKSIVPI